MTLGDFGLTPSPDVAKKADTETSGHGEAIVGLDGEAFEAAVATLQSVAAALNADCVCLREKQIEPASAAAPTGGKRTAQYLVRHRADEKDFMEVR